MPTSGKWQRGCPDSSGRGYALLQLNAHTSEHIPALVNCTSTTKAAYARGQINNHKVEVLLDLGASCSVIHQDYVSSVILEPMSPVKLINADGRGLSSLGPTTMKVQLNDLKAKYTFVVVERLSVPAILGCNVLTTHDIALDFGRGTFPPWKPPVYGRQTEPTAKQHLQPCAG